MTARLEVKIRVHVDERIAFGPGKAAVLEAIMATGSISAAGRQLGMSYRRTWLLVDDMNASFRGPLVSKSTGGAQGGGAIVTELGKEVLATFRDMEAHAAAALKIDARRLGKFLKTP